MSRVTKIVGLLAWVLIAESAGAATSTGMPWESPLTELLNSLTGPVARVVGAIAVFVFGILLAYSDAMGVSRRALAVVVGLAVAFNAISWGLPFLGFAGGLLM